MNLITKKAAETGIEAIVFIVSLPQYVVLEEDYLGKVRLMEVLNMLYDIPVDKEDFEKALEQRRLISEKVDRFSGSQEASASAGKRIRRTDQDASRQKERPELTSEMEDIFWRIMGKDIGKA